MMKGRLGGALPVSGQPVSSIEAQRVVTLLRVEGLAVIPDLIQRTDLALGTISTALGDFPSIDTNSSIEEHQRRLNFLQETASRLLRQLRKQRLLLDDLLASQAAITDAAWSQVEHVIKSVWPCRQDGSVPREQDLDPEEDKIAQALREIDRQLELRVDTLQHCLVQLGQRLLGLNQLRLRRMFFLSAE